MKSSRLFLPLAVLALAAVQTACEDDVSTIGGSISTGEVNITVDSLEYDLRAVAVDNRKFDSRSGSLLMGNINVPEYGYLDCSFVTRMLSITQFPDSMTVSTEKFNEFTERLDSCTLQLYLIRTNFIGDSLAPQQATAYKLTRQLPSNIDSEFDPTGYYDRSAPLGVKNFTVSGAGLSDDTFYGDDDFQISIPIGRQFAVDIFKKYQEDPSIFAWPQEFAKFLPGFYFTNSFGKGILANYSNLTINAYYHTKDTKPVKDDDGNNVKDEDGNVIYEPYMRSDSLILCSTAPEVLSSNNIKYIPSESLKKRIANGESILTTPGGYTSRIQFPAAKIVKDYKEKTKNLSIVSALSMTIPADTVANNYNISVAPYLLLVKTSEVDEFFAKNSLPDNKTSFYATYSSTVGGYRFTGLRDYIISLIEKDEVTEEDEDFTLVPVQITTETSSSYNSYTYVKKCTPYLGRPSMTRLDTKEATIVFTYSTQNLE